MDAGPARDGDQWVVGVGGAADGHAGADGVVEGLAGEDPRRLEVLAHHLHDPAPRHLGERQPARVRGRDRSVTGQGHAERLGHRGHRGRGAHDHAVPGRAREARLDLAELLLGEPAGPPLGPEAPVVRAGADVLGAPAPAQHGPAGHHDRRHVGGGRAHQHGGRGLVAAGEQHHAVQRIGADALLHVHRHQVAEEHGGGLHQDLAQRDRRELQREPAGRQHPALHRLRHLTEVRVAVGQLGPGVGDTDHRPAVEHQLAEALRLDPRAVGEAVQVLLAAPVVTAQHRRAPPGLLGEDWAALYDHRHESAGVPGDRDRRLARSVAHRRGAADEDGASPGHVAHRLVFGPEPVARARYLHAGARRAGVGRREEARRCKEDGRRFASTSRRSRGDGGGAEGKSLAVETRWAADSEALPDLAAELVRSGVDVILSPGPAATMAATKETATVPIVMIGSTDPRTMGAAGLARPGGNLTGLTVGLPEMMAGKRLELLTEALPGIRTVAVLWDVKRAADSPAASELAAAARALKGQLRNVEVAGVGDYERAFASAKRSAAGGVLLVDSPRSVVNRALIAELALKHRLALTCVFSRLVEAGALLSYGPELSDLFDRAASYVDKILRGAKPGALPIDQPSKFELAINLKRAKALGVSLPPSLVARADRVIE